MGDVVHQGLARSQEHAVILKIFDLLICQMLPLHGLGCCVGWDSMFTVCVVVGRHPVCPPWVEPSHRRPSGCRLAPAGKDCAGEANRKDVSFASRFSCPGFVR